MRIHADAPRYRLAVGTILIGLRMPLYFAYGSNMDVDAMRTRCPQSEPIGPARLEGHRFVLMGRSGYASLHADRRSAAHGLLYDLALQDVGSLDRYEDVAHGLYRKAFLPVRPVARSGSRQALVYLGVDLTEHGSPPRGYMEAIVAAARAAALPETHIAKLSSLVPAATAWRQA